MFGGEWKSDSRCQVLPCGIEIDKCGVMPDPAVRCEFGISPEEFVVCHVGRFHHVKNHRFLVEIMHYLRSRTSSVKLLLVGDGPLRNSIEEHVRELGLERDVIFAGLRSDVPRILANVDAFVMPSLAEGLPLAAIEAQAAGVRCVLSDTISREVQVVPGLVRQLPLRAPVAEWADAIYGVGDRLDDAWKKADALRLVIASDFNIRTNVNRLENIYLAATHKES